MVAELVSRLEIEPDLPACQAIILLLSYHRPFYVCQFQIFINNEIIYVKIIRKWMNWHFENSRGYIMSQVNVVRN